MFIDFNDIMFGLRNGRYVYIGSGSSREVYDLENGYVVKVAKNKAGIEQNRAEYYISANDSSGIFAKVIEASNDYGLLIMRKAKKIKDIRFVWITLMQEISMNFMNHLICRDLKINTNYY